MKDEGQGTLDRPPWDQSAVIAWYAAHGRHSLPWRLTLDPYAVLVSEVMLQQTQVDRVLPYFAAWIERWPTVRDLARAPLSDVLRAWAGLGYNRRAVHLHRAAVAVVERHGGLVPVEVTALRALPGVGEYTAAAVASFAGELPVAVTDTNIARLLARALRGAASQRALSPAAIRATAAALCPARGVDARDHNLALMDLGATVCTARGPLCGACPLSASCAWLAAGRPDEAVERASTPPFPGTARFARGRIVDALRGAARLDWAALERLLPAEHRPNLARYLAALERDGLVEGRDGAWRLAGALRQEEHGVAEGVEAVAVDRLV